MTAAIVLFGLVGAVVLGGVVLEVPRVVSSSVTISAPESAIYRFLSDLKGGWTQWSPLMTASSGMALEYGSTTSGSGAGVEWTGKAGAGSLTLTECIPLQSVSYQTRMGLGGMVAAGRIELRQESSGTRVTWTDELSVGSNPLWRWLAFAMDGTRERNLEQGLAALQRISAERP